MKRDKKVILLLLYGGIKAGLNPAQIAKENKINPRTLQYYLRQLKQNGNVQKVDYGIWKVIKEVSKTNKATSINKQIRGHAFNWKVKFLRDIDWKKRLDKKKIKYQLIGINKSTPRIIFNNKKIWFTKTGLIIYEPFSFYSNSAFTSKGLAVFELDRTIKQLGRKLNIDLSNYKFTTSREHYAQIKNDLAKQYNDKGEKLYIRDDNNSIWLWIDHSHGVDELEADKPKNSRGVQNWYNDMKKTNFEVTPTFVLNSINQVTQNQLMFNKNFESHVEAIQTLSKTVKELRIEIKNLRKNDKKN